ncbi:MAG: hypothetical protein J2P31_15110, partial [Blastocatellia bacterium]|nr:hypothetical protein [Blastocatellia bacterium]
MTRAQSDKHTDSDPVTNDPLIRIMTAKGMLTPEEARAIVASGTPEEQRIRLVDLLHKKGMISDTEYEDLRRGIPAPGAPADTPVKTAGTSSAGQPAERADTPVETASTSPAEQSAGQSAELPVQANPTVPEAGGQKPGSPPPVIPAVAPLRLVQVDPPKREGLIPDIKLGSGARLKPYGFFKTSVIYDSSSPQGNDFPLPLLAVDTGPSGSPEFHLRVRGLRLGTQFEWLDPAPKTVVTGRLEFDFEGNFTRVNNRNISSIRSSQASLRLGWGRIDRSLTDRLTIFGLFGQDWTPFGSSTVPTTIENSVFGGIAYGVIYERLPQVRAGVNYNFGGSRSLKLQPEFAITYPAFGNLPLNVADQLGYGERQGADSRRPAMEGRLVTQWQLDKAPGVLPAQFIISFQHARRRAIVTAAGVPAAFQADFPSGVEVD